MSRPVFFYVNMTSSPGDNKPLWYVPNNVLFSQVTFDLIVFLRITFGILMVLLGSEI